MSEVVNTGTVEIKYFISAHIVDGVTVYDWATATGAESDEYFLSIEEAVANVKNYF